MITLLASAFNSFSPWWFGRDFRSVIFNLNLVVCGWCITCKIALRWMSLDLTDDKSILVQVIVWCHKATGHCHSFLDQIYIIFLISFLHNTMMWYDTRYYMTGILDTISTATVLWDRAKLSYCWFPKTCNDDRIFKSNYRSPTANVMHIHTIITIHYVKWWSPRLMLIYKRILEIMIWYLDFKSIEQW